MTSINEERRCKYTIGHQEQCGYLAVNGDFCQHHTGLACIVCGEPATWDCTCPGTRHCLGRLCGNCTWHVTPDMRAFEHEHRRKP